MQSKARQEAAGVKGRVEETNCVPTLPDLASAWQWASWTTRPRRISPIEGEWWEEEEGEVVQVEGDWWSPCEGGKQETQGLKYVEN